MKCVRMLVGPVVGAIALAISATAASAAPIPPIAVPGWAGYFTSDVESSASTRVIVPRINCTANPAGNFAGQAEGVQFLDNFNGTTAPGTVWAAAVVRTYCVGHSPVYDAEFYLPPVPNPGAIFDPVATNVRVRPGDLVRLSVRTNATRSRARVADLSTGDRAEASGGGVTDAGPNIGVVALQGNGTGPTNIGSSFAVTPPAPSSPAAFLLSKVNGGPLTAVTGLGAQEWTNPSNSAQVLASPTQIAFDSFAVTFSSAS